MKEMYKNILIQGWMLDYIDGMSAEDGKKYLHCLIESAAAGEVITDNPLWEYWLEKSLSAIEETRAKYYAKAKKNGEKGKEYGKLGGRPRKGETKEQYKERKRLEYEALISENVAISPQNTAKNAVNNPQDRITI